MTTDVQDFKALLGIAAGGKPLSADPLLRYLGTKAKAVYGV